MKPKSLLSRLILSSILLTASLAYAQQGPPNEKGPGRPKPPLPPPPPVAVCPPPEIHYETDSGVYRSIGMDGRSGLSGRNGSSGYSPASQTIFATGAPVKLDLRAGDGGDATSGTDGEDASCGFFNPSYDRLNYNVQQPKGGSGGSAGRAGDGGNGGNTTIHFTNIAHLKNIYIDATPGVGGYGARAGRGGRGCGCSYYSWETESTKTVTRVSTDGLQKLSCIEPVRTTHYCRAGEDGSDAYDSSSGSNGRIGSVTLINSAQPLPESVTMLTLDIVQAAQGPVNLVKNIFESRSGAQALLAPGSVVSNTYSAYVRTAVLPVQVIWKARTPISAFAGSKVVYMLDSEGKSASINPLSSWIEGRTSLVNGTQIFTVERALLEKDVARLSSVISGNGKNTSLIINDEAGVTDLIDRTEITIEAQSKGTFSHDRFKGTVPAHLIQLQNNKYTISLHDLWLVDNSQKQTDGDLKKGKLVKIKVSVKRIVGNRSVTYDVNFDKYKLTDGLAVKD